ncbi:MAG: hypothetical protein PHO01_11935 [Desulfotomaculaceae bacterium]|nr:hypothetical protein [Desulfotomaculaceae bacterium]
MDNYADSAITTNKYLTNQPDYTSPLAKWARIFEIIIPIYMIGKSWGIAEDKNIELFRAQFPAFLVDACEFLKSLFQLNSVYLERFIATTSGAIIGLLVVLIMSGVTHFILNDRKYLDSLRFTAVTMIPIAVLNGMLSHGVQTLMNSAGAQSLATLKMGAVYSPWGYVILNYIFYMTSLWMMGGRTGVNTSRRWSLLVAGTIFLLVYIASGLMIFPQEWQALIPLLMDR